MRFLLILPILSAVFSKPVESVSEGNQALQVNHNSNSLNTLPNLEAVQVEHPSNIVAKSVSEHKISNGIPVNGDVISHLLQYLSFEDTCFLSLASRRTFDQITEIDKIKLDPVKYVNVLNWQSFTPKESKAKVNLVLKYLAKNQITKAFWRALTEKLSTIPFENWGDEVLNQVASGKIKIADNVVIDIFKTAGKRGHLEAVKALKEDPRVDNWGINNAFGFAASNGHTEVLKFLKNDQRVSSLVIHNALKRAACNGRLEICKILKDDQRVERWVIIDALREAASNGHLEVVELLKDRKLIDGI